MSEQPQEKWTGDTVRGLLPYENPCWIEEDGSRTYLSDKDLEPIADAHNAALAATYEQHHTELWRQCERLREQLAAAKADADNWFRQYKAMKCAGSTDLELELEKTEKQLAAERELKEKAIEAWAARNLKLSEQLAAERERHRLELQDFDSGLLKSLREQLDDEREKVKTLVEALIILMKGASNALDRKVAEAALAKAGNVPAPQKSIKKVPD
jgi:hypothetical protein